MLGHFSKARGARCGGRLVLVHSILQYPRARHSQTFGGFQLCNRFRWTPSCVITGQFTRVCTACFSNDLHVYNFSMHVAECVGMIANVGMKKDPD